VSRRLEGIRQEQVGLRKAALREELAVGAVAVAVRRQRDASARADRLASLAAERERIERERDDAVQSLLASVPYRAAVEEIAVTAAPDRLVAHTAATAASAALSQAYASFLRGDSGDVSSHGARDLTASHLGATATGAAPNDAMRQLAAMRLREGGLFAAGGYSDKRITSDPRWRLTTALAANNIPLRASAHAQAAMAALASGAMGGTGSSRGVVTATRSNASSIVWG